MNKVSIEVHGVAVKIGITQQSINLPYMLARAIKSHPAFADDPLRVICETINELELQSSPANKAVLESARSYSITPREYK